MTEPYTPSLDEARRAWWLSVENPAGNEGESDESFDRMIDAVRAEEREKAAQIALDYRAFGVHRNDRESIAAQIREGKEQDR